GAGQPPPAILAGVVVARIDIKARESHMALWHPFVCNKQQYPRYADKSSDYANPFVIDLHCEVAPTGEVQRAILLVNRARDALIQQGESALNRGYMHRQIRAVKHQYLAVQQGSSHGVADQCICGCRHYCSPLLIGEVSEVTLTFLYRDWHPEANI